MLRWISILVAAMVIIGLMAITTIGCGGNTPSGNTPSKTVDKLFQLTQEKNCQGVADLVTDARPELADRYVNDCKQIAERLVSYSIKRESIEGNGVVAHVEVEVTTKENSVEKTNYPAISLVKRDDDWKITELENRAPLKSETSADA